MDTAKPVAKWNPSLKRQVPDCMTHEHCRGKFCSPELSLKHLIDLLLTIRNDVNLGKYHRSSMLKRKVHHL